MFFENFNRICKEKGTTPTTVLRTLGLSTSKLALWKNGSTPKDKYVVMIAEHLNVSVAILMRLNYNINPLLYSENEYGKVSVSLKKSDYDEIYPQKSSIRFEDIPHEFGLAPNITITDGYWDAETKTSYYISFQKYFRRICENAETTYAYNLLPVQKQLKSYIKSVCDNPKVPITFIKKRYEQAMETITERNRLAYLEAYKNNSGADSNFILERYVEIRNRELNKDIQECKQGLEENFVKYQCYDDYYNLVFLPYEIECLRNRMRAENVIFPVGFDDDSIAPIENVEEYLKQLSKAEREQREREYAEKFHLLDFMNKNFVVVIAVIEAIILLLYSIFALSSSQLACLPTTSLKLVGASFMILGSVWFWLALKNANEDGKFLSFRLMVSGAVLSALIEIFKTFVLRL